MKGLLPELQFFDSPASAGCLSRYCGVERTTESYERAALVGYGSFLSYVQCINTAARSTTQRRKTSRSFRAGLPLSSIIRGSGKSFESGAWNRTSPGRPPLSPSHGLIRRKLDAQRCGFSMLRDHWYFDYGVEDHEDTPLSQTVELRKAPA